MIILGISAVFILCWIISGYKHGFVNGVLRLALWIIVWYIAIKFSKPVGSYIANFVNGQFIRTTIPQDVAGHGSQFLGSGIAFTVLLILGGVISHYVLRSMSIIRRIPFLGWVDGLLGAILYGTIGAVISFFVLQLLSVIPEPWVQDQFLNTPQLNQILDQAPFFAGQIYQWWL
ncbi:CvpA family protein [Leuconostoc palmae]|uniref:CvpA family protein n=1 Tax=Leuconostoc palmae TaxID=501487 RepID=UPI001C7CF011|nr:CvpA family protein [Leuconostoc palmae]